MNSGMLVLQLLHIAAGFIVLAEALNKLERCNPLQKGMTGHQRLIDTLKALAWMLLALGGGGALAGPVLVSMNATNQVAALLVHANNPSVAEVLTMVGFAVLIVRTRVKEG